MSGTILGLKNVKQHILNKVNSSALPGHQKQLQMLPTLIQSKYDNRKSASQVMVSGAKYKKSAVMIFLYPNKEGDTHFCLTKRHDYEGSHGGQICLPGGKHEVHDASMWGTAIRETAEEVGVQGVEHLANLTPLYIPVSNFIVWPFVGYSTNEIRFLPNEEEVEKLLETRLADFIQTSAKEKRQQHAQYSLNTPYYEVHEHVVWGATAGILSEFKALVEDIT